MGRAKQTIARAQGGRRGFAASKWLKVLLAICSPTCRTTVTKSYLREGPPQGRGRIVRAGFTDSATQLEPATKQGQQWTSPPCSPNAARNTNIFFIKRNHLIIAGETAWSLAGVLQVAPELRKSEIVNSGPLFA